MRAYERLLKYVKVHTTSAEDQGVTPSTPCQWDLARLLVDELKQLGLENPSVDENCIVTAWLPATPGCENAPALGFLAHMDTSPAFPGENVNPILHENSRDRPSSPPTAPPCWGRTIRRAWLKS